MNNSNFMALVRHTFIFAIRSFKRYKVNFFINLLGLSAGLAGTLLIYLWVNDESQKDKFHEHEASLYQVMGNRQQGDAINTWQGTSAQLADALEAEIPEVHMASGGTDPGWETRFELSNDEKRIKALGMFVEEDYFKMFSYPLIAGSLEASLSQMSNILVSESLAVKFFDTPEEAVGKVLNWADLSLKTPVKISGVFKDVPSQSTDQFEFVLSFALYRYAFGEGWQVPNAVTYVKLHEDADVDLVNSKLKDFLEQKVEGEAPELFLAPYADQYLFGKYENGVQAGGRITYLRLFSAIALFILIISCINFMNLATARATRRLKEVGVKKAIGAHKSTLIWQHLGESLLMSFLSILVAILLVSLFLPQFNLITDKAIRLVPTQELITMALLIFFGTGLLAGSYPAFYISSFNPVQVLKGTVRHSTGETWIRKGLVVFQFTLSILLTIGVMVVYLQVQYIQNKDLGIDKEHIVQLPREGKLTEGMDAFLDGVRQLPGVSGASAVTNGLLSAPGVVGFSWDGQSEDSPVFKRYIAYYDFAKTLGLEMTAGQEFIKEANPNEHQIILNEEAVKVMGLEEPVGQKASLWGNDARIVGVVKDFHAQSLHESIGPVFLHLDSGFLTNVVIRAQQGAVLETLERIEDFYEEFNPGYAFEPQFLDQEFNAQYATETRVAALSRYFAFFAILISLLGLFGLAAFTAERKMKEVGIRKILGSGITDIVYLFSKDFTRVILLAIVLAVPAGYLISDSWLNNFAYAISIEWWFFAGAAALALFTAWAVIGLQMVKVVRANPLRFLRED